jgi:hypothetical protein
MDSRRNITIAVAEIMSIAPAKYDHRGTYIVLRGGDYVRSEDT